MSDRQPISKKLRFEVFKRDSFACQYCGRQAPNVILHCDHLEPVAEGGASDILNLITSCADCNAGKGARRLSDDATLTKQLNQLAELNERREQINMMLAWQKELAALDSETVDCLVAQWHALVEERVSLTPTGRDNLQRAINKHGAPLVLQAMRDALSSYARRDENHVFTKESLDVAFDAIARVASVLRAAEKKPYLRRLFYIRGILRNRLSYLNERMAMGLMEEACEAGVDLDELENFAKKVSSWTQFRSALEAFTQDQQATPTAEKII
jgi:hypothetical protein